MWTCCANQIRPNCSVGSEQDEAEIQYDRWSTLEWCIWKKCEKRSTSSECMCHEIQVVKAFHLKFKARLFPDYSCSENFYRGI